jgi:hypothetical protein
VVAGLSPPTGTAAGGTPVTITGTGFTGATTVDFGTTAATHFVVVNDTEITADSPAGTGTVNVTVTTPIGTSATSPADQFTYTAATAPVVTGISPVDGPNVGGTLVTISGSGFTGATVVDFGTTAATSFTVVNDTDVTATSPAGTGTVDVTVTTPIGTSATSPADQFTYTVAVAPTVTGLSPTTGAPAGGTSVTITGTGFTGATAVDFGTTAATAFTVVSDTDITATSPAGTGAVNVTVTTPSGTSATTTADQFTYATVAAPTVVSLVRFGFHEQPTTLVLTFSTAMATAPAENVNNYSILTSSGATIPISSAVYDATNFTVTLSPTELLSLQQVYQLTVTGTTPSGLTGSTGVPLAGDGTTSGTNYVTMFSGEILGGAQTALATAVPKRFAALQREYAKAMRKYAAETKTPGVEDKKLAAAAKRFAVMDSRIAADTNALADGLRLASAPTAASVDALSALGELNVKPKAISAGRHHRRG